MNKKSSPFVYCLLIFAFLTSGISPACQFISGGKNFIEICAFDGTLKRVEVPADQTPFDEPQEDNKSHYSNNDCAFCFAQHNQKTKPTSADYALLAPSDQYLSVGSESFTFKSRKQSFLEARAPPQSFS